jgi:hypothetical protein
MKCMHCPVPAWVCGQRGEPYFEEHEVKTIQRLLLQLDRQTANLAASRMTHGNRVAAT